MNSQETIKEAQQSLGALMMRTWPEPWPIYYDLRALATAIAVLEHDLETVCEDRHELRYENDDLKRRLTRALNEIDRLQSLMLPAVIREVHPC